MKTRSMFKAGVARISIAVIVSAGVGAVAVPSAAVAAPKSETTTSKVTKTVEDTTYSVATGRKVG